MGRRRRTGKLPSNIRQPHLHRRHPWASGLVVLLMVLVWLGRSGRVPLVQPPVASDLQRYHQRVFTVVKVVDGDTIDVDVPDGRYRHTRIRLWGVDTPETHGFESVGFGGEMYWGPEASEFARRKLLNNDVRLELVEGKTRDKYKRLLGYVYVVPSGAMFNESLLRGGHAYADTRFSHPRRERFRALEMEARADGVGLWHGVTVRQMPRWRQKLER